MLHIVVGLVFLIIILSVEILNLADSIVQRPELFLCHHWFAICYEGFNTPEVTVDQSEVPHIWPILLQ